MQQVNEFLQSSQQNSLSELERLHKSIKQNYLAFAKGWTSVYESILFRTKLSNPLKLSGFGKYAKLMRIEENVCLAKVEHLVDFLYKQPHFVDVLQSNRIRPTSSARGIYKESNTYSKKRNKDTKMG